MKQYAKALIAAAGAAVVAAEQIWGPTSTVGRILVVAAAALAAVGVYAVPNRSVPGPAPAGPAVPPSA